MTRFPDTLLFPHCDDEATASAAEHKTMKLHIDEMHQGGFILEGEEYKGVQILYSIVDGDTGRRLTDQDFSSYETADAYAATHFSSCERWTPPPPSAEELEELMRIVNWMEKSPSDVVTKGATGRGIWARLSHQVHQRSHEPSLVTRIRALLTRFE